MTKQNQGQPLDRDRKGQQQGQQNSDYGRQAGQAPQDRGGAREQAHQTLHPKEQGGWGEEPEKH